MATAHLTASWCWSTPSAISVGGREREGGKEREREGGKEREREGGEGGGRGRGKN